ncbi:uncharacterized protein LOC131251023 isoform X2 [Magnolia sinica]|uniref:uncharacterized protein LOC131251023 isoform X2 n=1 Tax=Magnolia sinica TaxID=86752 RepID=UPI0026594CB2|nr:uncharacterized protein LOC131251023 isoform X2 [Magnolia sinica]
MPPPIKLSKKHHKRLNNPFPSTPKSLPFIPGNLVYNSQNLPHHHQTFPIGHDFQLHHTHKNCGSLVISHQSQPHRSIWSTASGQAFVSAAFVETEVEESRGSFVIKDRDVLFICNHQSVEDIQVLDRSTVDFSSGSLKFDSEIAISDRLGDTQFPALIITGWIFSGKKILKSMGGKKSDFETKKIKLGRVKRLLISARYRVLLYQENQHQVGFRVDFGKPNLELHRPKEFPKPSRSFRSLRWRLGQFQKRRIGWFSRHRGFTKLSSDEERQEEKVGELKEFNRVFITYTSEADERFYGFGEQFSHMEFKGRRVPILVQEQGVGRGDQPITLAANLVSYRSGGDSSTTYAPSPFYMTSKMRSLYLEGYGYSIFDLTKRDRVQIQIYSDSVQGRILNGNTPVELIERFTDTIGRPPELPKWIISGAVVGMQGGTEAVCRVWDRLQDYNVPISAFWLQDWVGQRETMIGSQLWWNWEVDTTRYAGWTKLVDDLRSHNIKMMAYCNPCLAPIDDKPNKKKNLFEEANDLGILVKDEAGETYMIPNTAFDVGMLDFTHPAAGSWFKKILREMVDSGVRGWMADFGEGLPLDACLFSGEDPISAHNRYPELWAKINREFVDEWKSTHQATDGEDDDESLVFFMRAGFRDSPKWGMLFWEGDQMVSWQNNDGIKSAVVGLLSSGLSGFAFNHSDIGGYCAVNLPIIGYRRSEELLLRWMELNAFSTVFRTHEGNNPSANTQFYSNDRTLLHFARFAKVYKAWEFYRIQLVKQAAQKGLPVTRHLFIHFPDDDHVHSLTYQQFLVGTEILVVPVLNKGKNTVKAYFPLAEGCSWIHIWTGKLYGTPFDHSSPRRSGFEAWVEAPIGYPAVFVKFGSQIGEAFVRNLRDFGIL